MPLRVDEAFQELLHEEEVMNLYSDALKDRAITELHEAVYKAISFGMSAKEIKEAVAESFELIHKDIGIAGAKEIMK